MRKKKQIRQILLLALLAIVVCLIVTAVSIVQYGKRDKKKNCDVRDRIVRPFR